MVKPYKILMLNWYKTIDMKKVFTVIFMLSAISAFAFQDSTGRMPPEETRPTSYWWWALGVVITLGIGMFIYRMIKKDPSRDG